ncbi:MAG: methyltransferase domain-containing protein, partial [Gammaproteobacteria bacterium]
MKELDIRTLHVLTTVNRTDFITSPDLSHLLSGHSIPSTMVVQTLLSHLPTLQGHEKLLLIGAGSGYLAMILARLVQQLFVIEHNPQILHIAQTNLAKFAQPNITLRTGDGERGYPEQAPYDLIIAGCDLPTAPALLPQVQPGGEIYYLSGSNGH